MRLSVQLVFSEHGHIWTVSDTLCGDGKLSSSATISLSSWRFRAQLEEACGAHLGVNNVSGKIALT